MADATGWSLEPAAPAGWKLEPAPQAEPEYSTLQKLLGAPARDRMATSAAALLGRLNPSLNDPETAGRVIGSGMGMTPQTMATGLGKAMQRPMPSLDPVLNGGTRSLDVSGAVRALVPDKLTKAYDILRGSFKKTPYVNPYPAIEQAAGEAAPIAERAVVGVEDLSPATRQAMEKAKSATAGQMTEALTQDEARALYGKQAPDPQQGVKLPIANDLTPATVQQLERGGVSPGTQTPQAPTVSARAPTPEQLAAQVHEPQMAGESFGKGPSRLQRGATKAQLEYRAKMLQSAAPQPTPPAAPASQSGDALLKAWRELRAPENAPKLMELLEQIRKAG